MAGPAALSNRFRQPPFPDEPSGATREAAATSFTASSPTIRYKDGEEWKTGSSYGAIDPWTPAVSMAFGGKLRFCDGGIYIIMSDRVLADHELASDYYRMIMAVAARFEMTVEEYNKDQQRQREDQASAGGGGGYSTRPPNRARSAVMVVLLIVAAGIVGKYAWNKGGPPAPANTRPESQVASKGRPVNPTPPVPADTAPESQHRRPSPYTDPSLARQTEPPATPNATPAAPPAGQVIEFQGVDHKGVNKNCDRQGVLILDGTRLRFNCPSKPERSFVVERTALRADDDGVITTSGNKYHFKIEGMNKDRVRAVFRDWAP